ncbi:glycosyltransferase [Paraclostridium dentum]|uniref:glycosyltransferase n=1 Tax=Paraclostridium dentum TaxID=2662455 RepID=UPI00147506A2|nr:glycosyltransferase [Paraclostridium dentum]
MLNVIKNELMKNNLELALNLILENEQIYKDNVEFINLKSILCIKAEEYEIAINHLESAMSLDSYNVDINYNLAYVNYKIGNIEKSIELYKKVLELGDDEIVTEVIDFVNSKEYFGFIRNYVINLINEKKLSLAMEFVNKVKTLVDGLNLAELKNIILSEVGIDENMEVCNNSDIKILDTILTDKLDVPDDIIQSRSDINSKKNRPLVSLAILGYNKLEEYTKKCVESVLKYTKDVDYELILVDNGSTDGTYEYFKSVDYDRKKIIKITKNIGVGYPTSYIFDELKGKYIMCLPNDIIVTKNWLSNMIKCAESDDRIGMINPVLDNVTNCQSVDLNYTDIEDMQKKAANFNKSNPRLWNERLKLITLGSLFRKDCIDVIGITDYGFIHHYADDDISFRVRRAGYKAVLCKDTFISHIGKTLDKGRDIENIGLTRGNEFFTKKYYGINSLDAMNYETNLLSLIDDEICEIKNYKTLGIDTLCGTPILELKNKLRENGIFNTELYAFSTEAKYWTDLNTICDDVKVDRIEYICEYYNVKFDYIILGIDLNNYKDAYKLLNNLMRMVEDNGSILIKVKNCNNIKSLLQSIRVYKDYEKQFTNNINIDILNQQIVSKGYRIESISGELIKFDSEEKEYLENLLKDMNISIEQDSNMFIETYLVKIKKEI